MDTKIPRLMEIWFCTRWMGSGWRAGLMQWRGLVGFVLIVGALALRAALYMNARNVWGGLCFVPVDHPTHSLNPYFALLDSFQIQFTTEATHRIWRSPIDSLPTFGRDIVEELSYYNHKLKQLHYWSSPVA